MSGRPDVIGALLGEYSDTCIPQDKAFGHFVLMRAFSH